MNNNGFSILAIVVFLGAVSLILIVSLGDRFVSFARGPRDNVVRRQLSRITAARGRDIAQNLQVQLQDANFILDAGAAFPASLCLPGEPRPQHSETYSSVTVHLECNSVDSLVILSTWASSQNIQERTDFYLSEGCSPTMNLGTPFAGGVGTVADPYLICSAAQLNRIGVGTTHMDKHFKLVSDIDMSAIVAGAYNIIGKISGIGATGVFTGSLDGNIKTIRNFTLNDSTQKFSGLFGVLGVGSVVRDLSMENVNITVAIPNIAGALAGADYGSQSVENIVVKNLSIGGTGFAGGLVGLRRTPNVTRNITIEAQINLLGGGGLAYENCMVTFPTNSPGNCTSSTSVGDIENADVTLSFTNTHPGTTTPNGGLFGWSRGGSVRDSIVKLHLQAAWMGGVAGTFENGSIENVSVVDHPTSMTPGIITDYRAPVGGLVGVLRNSEISQSVAAIQIRHPNSASGGLGLGFENGIGGLVGVVDNTTTGLSRIHESHAQTSITLNGVRQRVGGLVGYIRGELGQTTIEDSYASGAIVFSGLFSHQNLWTGGLVGEVSGPMNGVLDELIQRSYAKVDMTLLRGGVVVAGGLIGRNVGANIQRSFAKGSISSTQALGPTKAGGFIGELSNVLTSVDLPQIQKSFSNTNIDLRIQEGPWPKSAVGGFVGSVRASEILESFSIGSVSIARPGCLSCAETSQGGFAGIVERSLPAANVTLLKDVYARGTVVLNHDMGNSKVGAFAGFTDVAPTPFVINTYTSSDLQVFRTGMGSSLVSSAFFSIGPDPVGYGLPPTATSLSESYYDSDRLCTYTGFGTLNCQELQGATAKTTSELKSAASYPASWDFATVWNINPAINDGYPSFRWQSETNGLGWDFAGVWQVDPMVNDGDPTLRNSPPF